MASSPAPRSAEAPGAPAAAATLVTEAFARLSFEIHRIPRPGSRITSEIEGRVLNRCVLAAMEVLSAASAAVELAGTELRPVLDATFKGTDAATRAAGAAGHVLAAVRRVQRAAESEFQVAGAMTAGHVVRNSAGVVATAEWSDALLHRLRERAAPGQIVLSQGAFEICRSVVEAVPLWDPAAGAVSQGAPTGRVPANGQLDGEGDGRGPASDAYVLVGMREVGTTRNDDGPEGPKENS